jgi:hypothetical protein
MDLGEGLRATDPCPSPETKKRPGPKPGRFLFAIP